MKVRIVLDFGDVDPASKRGMDIVEEVCESAETIRIGFDANDVYVDVINVEDNWEKEE